MNETSHADWERGKAEHKKLSDTVANRYDELYEDANFATGSYMRFELETIGRIRTPNTAVAVDLGCGTGLAAAAFAREVDYFIGIDLSPRMIERARSSGLYAQLEVAEMVEGLRSKPDASAEIVLAADAMVYLSDLAPVLHEVKRVLVTGGLLAFTVETHRGDGVMLGEGLRYAHAAPYVRASIRDAGLALSQFEELSARNEDNVPAPGLVVVATR